MRYRQLTPSGDYTFGLPFYVNDTNAVAQAISTRLKLWYGEWFLDTTDGTPWLSQILGPRAQRNPDAAIKQRILGTPGVVSILSYSSTYTGSSRSLTVNVTVNTLYGTTTISETLA